MNKLIQNVNALRDVAFAVVAVFLHKILNFFLLNRDLYYCVTKRLSLIYFKLLN